MATAKKCKATRAAAGYVRKLPSGRYQASHVLDGKGYTAPMTYDAKIDAEAWVRGRLTDIARGAWSPELVEAATAAKAARSQTLCRVRRDVASAQDAPPAHAR